MGLLMSRRRRERKTGKTRIYNPKTRSYYSIRVRSTKKGTKGTIKGKWKPKK